MENLTTAPHLSTLRLQSRYLNAGPKWHELSGYQRRRSYGWFHSSQRYTKDEALLRNIKLNNTIKIHVGIMETTQKSSLNIYTEMQTKIIKSENKKTLLEILH